MTEDTEKLRQKVIEALRQVYDPEIPVNVVDLGLVYDVKVTPDKKAYIKMTLTAPGCPIAGLILMQAEETVKRLVPELKDVQVELVFDPPWDPTRITREGREKLKELYGYDVVEEWIRRMKSQQNQQ
ncbi:MAG: DUF59 domain-containing protein [Crenarchaeota archaeon]|nr:DUF59 domain-containing protein [Thermoproteota archaeon]